METPEILPNVLEEAGRAYTKRLGSIASLQALLQLSGITAYCYLDLPRGSAMLAELLTSNFYLQVALCWIPVWIIYTASALPFLWQRFQLDRKFRLSEASFGATFWDFLKAKALVFIFGCALLEIMFASHRRSPAFGWAWAGALCAFLFLVVDRSLPFLMALFYPVRPLGDISLRDRINLLAGKAGLRLGAILEWQISGRTRQANALVFGIGPVRRILLTDTLLRMLSEDEVEAIVAHELGHCALHHIVKRVLLQGLVFCGIFWVINAAVMSGLVWFGNKRLGWANLNLIPGILVMYVFGWFYGHFIMAALSRRQERAADLYSWKLMGRTAPFIAAMRKLEELNLIVFDKSAQWKHGHPSTAERIAAAKHYERAHLETLTVA
jgi:STE24 endopeptidase